MKLWFLWVLATSFAFSIGGGVVSTRFPSEDPILDAYFGLSASVVLASAFQWLILRVVFKGPIWWMTASISTVVIIGCLVFGIGNYDRDVGWVLGVILGWLILGLFQWWVIRNEVQRAEWWFWGNLAGLIAAIPLVGFVTWSTGEPASSIIGGILRWLAFGAAIGVCTGGTLVWILGHPQRLDLTRRD